MTTGERRAMAIVIGAGIAGLTASRVLGERFDRVLLLDRDDLPDAASPRRGVPQSSHPHVLLASGQRALDRLFPGLSADLAAAGAVPFDSGADLRVVRFGAQWAAVHLDLTLLSMSRPLLELALRRRVAGMANVTIRAGVAVAGLTGDSGRVTGVVTDDGERLLADLVVDCSGRGSRSDRWLAALGAQAPGVEEVKVGISYATRVYRRESGQLADAVAGFVLPTAPREKAVGLILPIEDDRWLVGLGGWHGASAPADDEGYLRYARELPSPMIADVMAAAEPLGAVAMHRFPSSRRRRFEHLTEPPAGYLAAGDAVCSFNPVYGQGMTCAALAAEALGRVLDRHAGVPAQLTRQFYAAVAETIAVPWRFAVGADFTYPETTGPRPRGIRLLNAYSRRLQRVAQVDPEVRRVFTEVQHLLRPPTGLFTAPMLARVLRGPRAPHAASRPAASTVPPR